MHPRRSLALALAFAHLGCSSSHRDSPAPPPSTGSAGALSAAAQPAGPPRPSPREHDPLWLLARDEDPAERQRLALAVGAAGLLEGVDDGGDTAALALSALPYADDADLALGKLADLAQTADPAHRRALLDTILTIAGHPRKSRELLDPEGVRRCAETMVALAARDAIPRDDRAIAVSIARALAEKGFVDPARIPADLDPK
jgi:hypothetical protein